MAANDACHDLPSPNSTPQKQVKEKRERIKCQSERVRDESNPIDDKNKSNYSTIQI